MKNMEQEADRVLLKIQNSVKQVQENTDVSNAGLTIVIYYLGRWSASIYSLIWVDLLLWCIVYAALSLMYRLGLSDYQKTVFEDVVVQVGYWSAKIPVTFLLGFFVSNVVSRWWSIFLNIPKMAGPAAIITGCIRSKTNPEEAAQIRITITRYLNLAWVLAFWEFCGPLQVRYKLIQNLANKYKGVVTVDAAGKFVPQKLREFMSKEKLTSPFQNTETDANTSSNHVADEDGETEDLYIHNKCRLEDKYLTTVDAVKSKLQLLNMDPIVQKYYKYMISKSEIRVFLRRANKAPSNGYVLEWWIPIFWALALADEALSGGYVRDTNTLVQVQGVIYGWYSKIRLLINYAKRNLPLVYIQVVIIAVYTTYLTELITSQFIITERSKERKMKEGYAIDYYFPILAIIHITFVLGWFKVAMVLLDPFGNDIEDFPFSDILNGNIKTGAAQAANNPLLYPKLLRSAVRDTHLKTGAENIISAGDIDESSDDDIQPNLSQTKSQEDLQKPVHVQHLSVPSQKKVIIRSRKANSHKNPLQENHSHLQEIVIEPEKNNPKDAAVTISSL